MRKNLGLAALQGATGRGRVSLFSCCAGSWRALGARILRGGHRTSRGRCGRSGRLHFTAAAGRCAAVHGIAGGGLRSCGPAGL